MKIRVVIKRSFGDIELEGDSLDEIIEHLQSVPDWLTIVDKMILGPELAPKERSLLLGLVEFSQEGPLLIAPRESLSDKEALGLLLYARDPDPVEPKELGRLLSLSGRPSAGFGARLSEMRREGLVLKEGEAYRLSVNGRKWIEDVAVKLGRR
jgi:hypothetical protein